MPIPLFIYLLIHSLSTANTAYHVDIDAVIAFHHTADSVAQCMM